MNAEPVSDEEQIGQNLARLRGNESQRKLAARMQAAGRNWTHLTVAAVERGERPLRLAEASRLARLFGVDVTQLLGSPDRPEALRSEDVIRAKHIFVNRILEAVDEYYTEQEGHSDDPA